MNIVRQNSNEDQQVVLPIGRSWVKTNSRSYPGKEYYFNTETGEAVWNLCDSPNTKDLCNSNQSQIKRFPYRHNAKDGDATNIPEPAGPPDQQTSGCTPNSRNRGASSNFKPSSHSYNKHKVTNHYSRNICQVPEFGNSQFPNHLGYNPMPYGTNMHAPFSFNPNFWPAQVFIPPTAVSAQNQPSHGIANNSNVLITTNAQSSSNFSVTSPPVLMVPTLAMSPQPKFTITNNFAGNNGTETIDIAVKSTPIPLSSRFKILNQIKVEEDQSNFVSKCKLNSIDKCSSVQYKLYMNHFKKLHNNDLRLLLANRKKSKDEDKFGDCIDNNISINEHRKTPIECINLTNDCSDDDKYSEMFEPKEKIDVACLKSLAAPICKNNCWYIVVDTDILLNNLNFVNLLAKSDMNCRMMVPLCVRRKLAAGLGGLMAHRATQYINCGLLTKSVVIGQPVLEKLRISGRPLDDDIVKCCIQLKISNDHVILLTNNENRKIKAGLANIICFTVKQMQDYVGVNDSTMPPSPESLKITVPNQVAMSNDLEQTKNEGTIPNSDYVSFDEHSTVNNKNKVTEICETITNDQGEKDALINTKIKKSVNQRSKTGGTEKVNTDKPKFKIAEYTQENGLKSKGLNLKRKLDYNENEKSQFICPKRQCTNETKNNLENVQTKGTAKNNMFLDSDRSRNEQNIESHLNTVGDIKESTVEKNGSLKSNINTGNDVVNNNDANINKNTSTFETKESFISRSDEWVSRFVQIMEEVLTQILQQNVTPATKLLFQAPWSLPEATQCIKQLCSAHLTITDAANRLWFTLFKNSDNLGHILPKMKQDVYMTMYNQGVGLLKALKSTYPRSVDIKTGEDLLHNLLFDIRNCNHNANNDFIDINKENFDNISLSSTNLDGNGSLNTTNTRGETVANVVDKDINREREQDFNKSNQLNTNVGVDCNAKVIRNFSMKIPEFENNLSWTKNITSNNYLSDELDYSEDLDYNDYDESKFVEDKSDKDNVGSVNDCDNLDVSNNNGTDQQIVMESEKIESNDLAFFILTFLNEIKEMLVFVNKFCKDTNAELTNKETDVDKLDIQIKADNMYQHIESLLESLKIIMYRETNDPENSVYSEFVKAGLKDVAINETIIIKYKIIVSKLIHEAEILLKAVKIIIGLVQG